MFVAASQGGGKTETILCTAGYFMDLDPSPILVVEPVVEMAEAFSKDRLSGMIRLCPSLRSKVADPRSRDSGNTITHKQFPGGHITLVGANSAAGLSMRPIRVLLFDEIDRYQPSAGTEGDPVRLAEARTSAFWNARKVYVTSPGTKKTSRVLRIWERSDQREYFVPCPDCGHEQVLVWAQVTWEKNEAGEADPTTAAYACKECGSAWDDVKRWGAIRKGHYKATKELRRIAGFRLSALAVLGRRLEDMVQQWIDVQGNPEELKVFINTVLAEWWEDEGELTPDEHELQKRCRAWPFSEHSDLPDGVAVLTMGVDVQANRLEYEVVGWGSGEESWSLHYGQIFGDPLQNRAVFDELDAVLARPWKHPKAGPLYVRGACVDTGYGAAVVYRYLKPRLRRPLPDGRSQFVFGYKGASRGSDPIWPVQRAQKSRNLPTYNRWTVNADAAKEQIYGRLYVAEPGPGYCHFPQGRALWYFEQLTSEHRVLRYRSGVPHLAWELKLKGRPNEALDCRVMAYAALCGLQSPPFLMNLEGEVVRIAGAAATRGPEGGAPATRPRARGRRSKGVEA